MKKKRQYIEWIKEQLMDQGSFNTVIRQAMHETSERRKLRAEGNLGGR
jgi:hypothetical protein